MAKLGLEPRSPAPCWPSAVAPAGFSEPLSPVCAPGAGKLCENPGFAAWSPPGAGSQQRQARGFPGGLLASAGVGLVTGMRSLLTSGWGRMPSFGNFHSEPLDDFVPVCKKNKPVGWSFALGLRPAGLGKLLGHDKPLGGSVSQVPRRVAPG